MDIEKLKIEINNIGQKITNCEFTCEKVENKRDMGIIPRGLYLETKSRDTNKIIIVVGMNPGKMKDNCNEIKDILKKPKSYENYKKALENNVLKDNPYFERTREMLRILGFNGAILWTEIVKCQSEENGKLPYSTIRNCVHTFLKKEVSLIDCPILALGDKVYNTCLLIFPERKIIGVSHPSGANRGFPEFLKRLENKKEEIKNRINNLKESESIHVKDIIGN